MFLTKQNMQLLISRQRKVKKIGEEKPINYLQHLIFYFLFSFPVLIQGALFPLPDPPDQTRKLCHCG